MTRRLLVALIAGGALTLTACGAAPPTTSASGGAEPAPASSSGAGGGASADTEAPADLEALQRQADQVIEELFVADRDLDYDTIETLTSRAVAARYRNQQLLSSIDDLDPQLKAPAMESVTITSDLEVTGADDGAVTTTGEVEVTYTDADGNESPYTYTDVVFEQDGDDLLVADFRNADVSLPASAAFLDTTDVDPVTVDDLTVQLEPGYRDPDADPAFVEYVFTVTSEADEDFEVSDAVLTTPDDETYGIQFGAANTVEPGETAPARVGFEGPSVPVSGGTLEITIEDGDGNATTVEVEVPAFLDEDGDPEPVRPVELADVDFSTSGTISGGEEGAPTTSDTTETLQEITDAEAFRDSLLAIAEAEHDPTDPAGSWGIPDAWLEAVPGLDLVGFQIEATPTKVSGFSITGDKAGTIEGLPFAVADASGGCAGGVVLGRDGRPTEFRSVDLSGAAACTAAAVIDAVGLS